jgi:cysteine-rich repeat protein
VPCHPIVCGDELVDWPEEQCDDGNTIPNDGCTNCTYDGGFGGSGGMGTGGTGFTGGSAGSFMGGAGFGG